DNLSPTISCAEVPATGLTVVSWEQNPEWSAKLTTVKPAPQVDRPPKPKRRGGPGRNPRYDSDGNWQIWARIMHEEGDCRRDEGPGWQGQSDLLCRLADDVLKNDDDERRRTKFIRTARPYARDFLLKWRAWKAKPENRELDDLAFIKSHPYQPPK